MKNKKIKKYLIFGGAALILAGIVFSEGKSDEKKESIRAIFWSIGVGSLCLGIAI